MTEQPARGGAEDSPSPGFLARLRGEIPFAIVVFGVALGLVIIGLHHFKRGSVLLGVALVVGAALRMTLPESRAGMLAVRGRAIDAACLVTLGVLIGIAAAIVPPPS